VLSFQGGQKTVIPGDVEACSEYPVEGFLDVALHPERYAEQAVDPGGAVVDEDLRMQYHRSITCLAELQHPTVVRPILRGVDYGLHPNRVDDLLSIVVRVGPRASDEVVAELTSLSPPTRHLAAMSLAYLGDESAKDHLVGALQGDDRRSLEASSYVLTELIVTGALTKTEGFAMISKLAHSIDPRIRRNALHALLLYQPAGPPRALLEQSLQDSDLAVAQTAQQVKNALRAATVKKYFAVDLDGSWLPTDPYMKQEQ
jgi:hypothetical protein